jgi:hypothetical protein
MPRIKLHPPGMCLPSRRRVPQRVVINFIMIITFIVLGLVVLGLVLANDL